MSKWISVKKRLPNEKDMVLCVGSKGGMFLGEMMTRTYEGDDTCCVYVPNSRNLRYATHWMPLPEPPESPTKSSMPEG